jgi:hypothetical protein
MGDTQWENLDGEPGTVESKGRKYTEIATAIQNSLTTLDAITNEIDSKSLAMEKTRSLAGDVREDIAKALVRYKDTGEALTVYGAALRSAKDEADPAVIPLREARNALVWANNRAASAQNGVDDLPDDAPQGDSDDAKRTLTNAQGDVTDAQGDITRYEAQWTRGHETKEQAAGEAIRKIEEVVSGSKVNGLEDSTWDKLKNLASTLYKVFKVICDIAGILAIFLSWVPILGQILVALAAIGAILSIIESAVKFAKGEIGILGLITGVGLGILSLAGGKIATHLTKLVKFKTLNQSSRLAARVLSRGGAAGAKFSDDAARFGNRLGSTPLGKLKYALKTPFVRTTGQEALAAGVKNGSITKMTAFKETMKTALPNPFKDGLGGVGKNLKAGFLGDASTMQRDLRAMGLNNVTMQGPMVSAQVMSAVGMSSQVANSSLGIVDAAQKGDGWAMGKSIAGVPGSVAGGSWGSVGGAPSTVNTSINTIDSVDANSPSQSWNYYFGK